MSARPRTWLWRLLVAVFVVAVFAAAVWAVTLSRKGGATKERVEVSKELAVFQRCLIGAPLAPNETLAGRIRGIDIANALDGDTDDTTLGAGGAPTVDTRIVRVPSPHDGREKTPDAGVDAGPPPLPPEKAWPTRCAPLVEPLAKSLRSEALLRDRSLDALRDAVPTHDRMLLPYALTKDEATDLASAIDASKLTLPNDVAHDGEDAPQALTPPISARDIQALGKGQFNQSSDITGSTRASTDTLATTTLRMIVRDAKGRLCTFEPDKTSGVYGTARCADLPDWMALDPDEPWLANVEDGSPTSLLVADKVPPHEGRHFGLLMLTKAGPKVVPMSSPPDATCTFVSKDGSYMIGGNYAALVRVGNADKIKTTSVTDPSGDSTAVKVMESNTYGCVAAYGSMFFNDSPSVYGTNDSTRRLHVRAVEPAVAPSATDVGEDASGNLISGCRSEHRVALLFKTNLAFDRKARLVVSEDGGPYKALDAPIGTTLPHLTCLKDAAAVTSVATGALGHVVVIEDRCTVKGCESKKSAPVAVWAGHQYDAASLENGVVLLWKIQPDHVLSKAKGMGFIRFASVEKLADALPTPLIENHRGGGFDLDEVRLIARPASAVIAMQWGGKTPSTYAVTVDGSGIVKPVTVEETKW